jgi:hypothetical protein
MDSMRIVRSGGVLAAAWALLYVRFSIGLFQETEVDPVVHWALLPIALLISVANWAAEVNGSSSVARRDALWGLAAALVSFGILHWAKVV